jgi:hypothetical protein
MGDDTGTTAQRIRIGLTGLGVAFLLVLLGSAISRSRNEDPVASNSLAQGNAEEPSEPLAEIGVAPGGSEAVNNNISQ